MPPLLTLTFDDGPDATWTAAVLRVLRAARVRATFFVVGERVRAEPRTLAAILRDGHEVELHCDRHLRHSELSAEQIAHDARAALETLARHGAPRPTRWRTPWGVQTEASALTASRASLELIGWDIDSHDWRGDTAPAMLRRAVAQIATGGVVLMHDALGPGSLRGECSNTVELTQALIEEARRSGIDVGPLSMQPRGVAA